MELGEDPSQDVHMGQEKRWPDRPWGTGGRERNTIAGLAAMESRTSL
jgi:hypothetical protein